MHPISLASAPEPPSAHAVAFQFVESLARELSLGRIELPSFPDVATRVRQALADDNVNVNQVARIIGSEPVLAASVLKMANSAALNRSGRPVTDLKSAVARMGHNAVRSAALAFAISQIRSSDRLRGLEGLLGDWWQRTTRVAALCHVIAQNCSRCSADEAFLVGLLHGVGQLYIYTRAADFPALLGDPDSLEEVLADWHANIAKAIVENWQISDDLVQAVGDQDDLERDHEGNVDLTDIVVAAKHLALAPSDGAEPSGDLNAPVFRRLGLTAERRVALLADFEIEIRALRAAICP